MGKPGSCVEVVNVLKKLSSRQIEVKAVKFKTSVCVGLRIWRVNTGIHPVGVLRYD